VIEDFVQWRASLLSVIIIIIIITLIVIIYSPFLQGCSC